MTDIPPKINSDTPSQHVDAPPMYPIPQEVAVWVGSADGKGSVALRGTCSGWEMRATRPPPMCAGPPDDDHPRSATFTLYLDDPELQKYDCTFLEFLKTLVHSIGES